MTGPLIPLAVRSPEPERTSILVPGGTCITIEARQGPKLISGQLPFIRTVMPSLTARRRGVCSEPLAVESIRTSSPDRRHDEDVAGAGVDAAARRPGRG